jgi:hypothetical protein
MVQFYAYSVVQYTYGQLVVKICMRVTAITVRSGEPILLQIKEVLTFLGAILTNLNVLVNLG